MELYTPYTKSPKAVSHDQRQLHGMRQTAPSAWRSLWSGIVCKQTDALVADCDAGDERSADHTHSVPTSSR